MSDQTPVDEVAVGSVDFGNLRRVRPVSSSWGYDRGTPIDRHYIEQFLSEHATAIQGCVLEIGDATYTNRFGGSRVVRSDVLNLLQHDPNSTIVGDLAAAPHIADDAFHCAIVTQTLQCIYDLRAAVRTIHRILKPGGTVLATFPGISKTSDPDWGDTWCWSLTTYSARRLFNDAFPQGAVHVAGYGNALAAMAFLQGLSAEELKDSELAERVPGFDVTIAVRATKAETVHIER